MLEKHSKIMKILKEATKHSSLWKGYDSDYLKQKCWDAEDPEIQFNKIIDKDLKKFSKLESELLKRKTPYLGDFVKIKGKYGRISVINAEGTIQISNSFSVYLTGKGSIICSGAVYDDAYPSGVELSELKLTDEVRKGSCHTNCSYPLTYKLSKIDYSINFKVWSLYD